MRSRPPSPLRRTAAALLAALLLGGCGSSTTVVTERPPSNSGSVTTASSPTTSQTAGTSSTSPALNSTPGALARCTARMLALSVLGQQGATGHGEIGVALRNTTSRTCHTFGYPGVAFLTAGGAALPNAPRRVTQDYFGTAPLAGIDLRPGQRASFRLGVTHIATSPGGCRTVSGLQVIPPDDTQSLRITIPNGIYECGTATVSPLRPGTSAFV